MESLANTAVSRGTSPIAPAKDAKAMKIFARTLFKDMVANGLSHDQILSLATNLIAKVTEDMKEAQAPKGRA